MKTNDLARWCSEHPDVEVFVSVPIIENNEVIDVSYHEIEIEVWDEKMKDSHYIFNPGKLVSG